LISSFIPWWSDKMQEIISIILNLLRLVLFWKKNPETAEKNVYIVAGGWNIL
jgi:hypothetical protein